MKRISSLALLMLCCAILSFAQGNVPSDITIKGKIEGIKNGRLLLVVQSSIQQFDTLAATDFKRGKFILKATLSEPMVTTLFVEGYQGGFTLLAEPGAKYTAYLANNENYYIKGGELNDAYVAHMAKFNSMSSEMEAVLLRYDELMRNNKYRSASLTNDTLIKCRKELELLTNDFMSKHDDLITAYILYSNIAMKDAALQECKRIYETMGHGAKATHCARMIKERIKRLEDIVDNAIAPDFAAPDINGDTVVMSTVSAKIKIIDFWASWCGPCRMNNPSLRKLYLDYHDKGLEIIGVSLDDKRENWLKAVEADGLEWINVSTLAGGNCEIAHMYNVTAIPSLFVLDENNRIIAMGLRGEKLVEFISEKLK